MLLIYIIAVVIILYYIEYFMVFDVVLSVIAMLRNKLFSMLCNVALM